MGLFLQQSNAQGSLPQALEYYKKAADKGQLQAMNNYGFIVAASTQDPAQAKEGIEFIKKAAEQGAECRTPQHGHHLPPWHGWRSHRTSRKRRPCWRPPLRMATIRRSSSWRSSISALARNQNDDKAWELLKTASDHGNPNALAALGSVLFDGKEFGVTKKKIPADPKGAVELFKKLAEQNNPAGNRTMGELYQKGIAGTGIEKDFAKALEYYGKAAQGNDAVAQVILAGFYDRGFDDEWRWQVGSGRESRRLSRTLPSRRSEQCPSRVLQHRRLL